MMNNNPPDNQKLIPDNLRQIADAYNGLNQANTFINGLGNAMNQGGGQNPNYNYNAGIEDPNNPYNVNTAQTGMAQSTMPVGVGQLQNAYSYLDKNGYLETRVERLSIRVPTCAENCYKRIFRRNVPVQCPQCGQQGNWDTKSNCGVGLIGCTVLFCLTCPQGIFCPFLIDDCYDHVHTCPQCKNEVGREKFILG